MTLNRLLRPCLGLTGLFAMVCFVPAQAQAQADTSTVCRLFPLACPGPTPPKPEPLLGAPDEQADAPPPSMKHATRQKRRVHKKAAAKPDNQ